MEFPDRAGWATVLAGNAWFTRQAGALRGALLDAATLAVLAKDQWLHSEGDDLAGLWAPLRGSIRLEVTVGPDRSQLLGLVRPGAIVGQATGPRRGPRLATARAAEESVVLLISDAALERVAAIHPLLWRSITELLHGQLDGALHRLADTLRLPPAARIATRILAETEAERTRAEVLRLTQADLGEMTGLSRKSVNGHLRSLERRGVVRLSYGAIDVIDRGRLRAQVDQGL